MTANIKHALEAARDGEREAEGSYVSVAYWLGVAVVLALLEIANAIKDR